MARYTVDLRLIFVSETNLPNLNFRGTLAEVEKMIGPLPVPADASRDSFAALEVERVVPSTVDPY